MQSKAVSLWVGVASSWEALNQYLTFSYNEDGDVIPSPFAHDFGISWFDEDFREASVRENQSASLHDLLAGSSYADEIITAFSAQIGDTLPFSGSAVVLLYDFKYDGRIKEATGDVQLRFIGSAMYRSAI